MRNLLYRGKRFDNGAWLTGDSFVKNIDGSIYLMNKEENALTLVRKDTFGEFTGCTDRNDIMIFEGDIDEDGFTVSYCNGRNDCYGMNVGWYLQRDDWESWRELDCDVEIVGNIFDGVK